MMMIRMVNDDDDQAADGTDDLSCVSLDLKLGVASEQVATRNNQSIMIKQSLKMAIDYHDWLFVLDECVINKISKCKDDIEPFGHP